MIEPKPTTLLELFEGHPERWTQGVAARNLSQWQRSPTEPDACQWCLTGAISLLYLYDFPKQATVIQRLMQILRKKDFHWATVSVWNDAPGRTHAEVVELCREAGV